MLGTRHCTFLHQQIVELLSYALVLSGNHVYTSGAIGTHTAVIRGALRAENQALLTVILPQTIKQQPPETRELLEKVEQVEELGHNELPLGLASRMCNSQLLTKVRDARGRRPGAHGRRSRRLSDARSQYRPALRTLRDPTADTRNPRIRCARSSRTRPSSVLRASPGGAADHLCVPRLAHAQGGGRRGQAARHARHRALARLGAAQGGAHLAARGALPRCALLTRLAMRLTVA
jgi:hypothetical protein